MFKQLNLKMKMLIYIGTVTFLSFAVTIGFVAVKAENMAEKNVKKTAIELAQHYGSIIDAEIEVAMDAARTLAQTFEGIKKSGQLQGIDVPEREVLDLIMKQILQDSPTIIGIGTIWEPNALDGLDTIFVNAPGHDATGRYVPYWSKSGGGITVAPLTGYDQPGVGDYYQIPKRTGEETVIEPYSYNIGGQDVLVTTLCAPIQVDGKFLGAVVVDIELETFNKNLSKVKIYENGYLTVISNGGLYVTHPQTKRLGQSVLKTDPWMEPLMDNIKSGNSFSIENHSASLGEKVGRVCEPLYIGESKTPWAVMVTIPLSEAFAQATQIRNITMGIGVAAMALVLTTLFFIVSSITGPIAKGADFAETMATGDLSKTLDIKRSDEVGKLMESLNNMTAKLSGMIKEITSGVDTLSTSSTDLAAISEQMTQGATQTAEKSEAVAAATEEMSTSMTSVAAAMEQASTNISMVASASEEMTCRYGGCPSKNRFRQDL